MQKHNNNHDNAAKQKRNHSFAAKIWKTLPKIPGHSHEERIGEKQREKKK
ncbi:hypothetical protein [Vibrio vulnificus]|nr:hypothetical protein [Vibrio vulnificus]